MMVIGGDNVRYRERVAGLYRGRFRYSKPLETDNTTAELIKYTLNGFFFLKTIFGNEVFNFAEKVGANYETVRTALENSPWGSKNHFKIFYKGRRGVHGSCLPKDTESFATQTNSLLFKTLLELNHYE
jgi:UDPglucose 6-dehydrogenase